MTKEYDYSHGSRRRRWFRKGNLKYVVLDLIKDEPRSGYDIIIALEVRSHGVYTPSSGAIYPVLQMLQDMGYVTSQEQDGRKTYTITDEGRSFLKERTDTDADASAGAKQHKHHTKDWWGPLGNSDDMREMGQVMGEYGKLGALLSAQFMASGSEKIARLKKVIAETRDKIEAILKD